MFQNSSYQRFTSSDPLGSAQIKMGPEAIERLEKYARENLVCIKCGKPIPNGDAFKMHVVPSDDNSGVEVRIACFPCYGLEADGKTERTDRLFVPGA